MIFTNGYASAANCAPSRACLMTGKWTTRHGIYTVGNSDRGRSQHRKLIPTENTTTLSKLHKILPQLLQENGYSFHKVAKENGYQFIFEKKTLLYFDDAMDVSAQVKAKLKG